MQMSNSVIKVAASGTQNTTEIMNTQEDKMSSLNIGHPSNNISVYSAASTQNQSMGRMFRSLSQNENKSNLNNNTLKTYTSNSKFCPSIPFLDLTKVNPNFSQKKQLEQI
tara:strand:+ start:2689 stop:3018 length:330 start_codon:yes stop_codon:yes gene_type:complete